MSDKPPINYELWARNAVTFIREKGLEQSFTDWSGGFPCPILSYHLGSPRPQSAPMSEDWLTTGRPADLRKDP